MGKSMVSCRFSLKSAHWYTHPTKTLSGPIFLWAICKFLMWDIRWSPCQSDDGWWESHEHPIKSPFADGQNWLVVSTPLKNISQFGWLFPIYGKTKSVQNHQPVHMAISIILSYIIIPSGNDWQFANLRMAIESSRVFHWKSWWLYRVMLTITRGYPIHALGQYCGSGLSINSSKISEPPYASNDLQSWLVEWDGKNGINFTPW